jgi:Zn-dependent protease/CBS domain-containing protein
MKWSWTLGRVAGIDIRMHWTFLLLLGWVAASAYAAGRGWGFAVFGITFILAIFACIVLHELGHALTAKRYGISTRDITLLPIGGLARLEELPEDPKQEFFIAAAGPAVNVAIAGILFIGLWMIQGIPAGIMPTEDPANTFFANLMWVNVALVLFNLLPAFPMDGGRILRALLATKMHYGRATNIAARIGQGMAILFAAAGLYINPILLLIAVFVFLGAAAEAQKVRSKLLTDGIPVRSAMMTDFRTLAPGDSLQKAADELLAGSQQEFPVLEHSMFQGMLRRDDLLEGLKADSERTVGDVMTRFSQGVGETDALDDSLELMRLHGCSSIPVMRGGQVIGLVTADNVQELMMLQSAARGRTGVDAKRDGVRGAA